MKDSALLTKPEEIDELARLLEKETIIAFDTEFIRESTFYPIVELIQVATRDQAWLVDCQAFHGKDKPGLQPLLDIFQNPNILKIVHAAQGDQECLYTSYAMTASPSFDTAIGASLSGYGDSLGLAKLLKLILDVDLQKGHARTHWSVRPLPAHLIDYALADVRFLVSLGEKLLEKCEELGRKSWALELSAKFEDYALYQPDIEGMTRKLARSGKLNAQGYAALQGLVQWREDRVRRLNLPRRWVADDHVLLDLAHVRPKDIAHLSSFRGLSKGEIKTSGEVLLELFRTASQAVTPAVREAPTLRRKETPPSREESQTLDLLRCFIAILAQQHQISPRHLTLTEKLLRFLREEPKTAEELVSKGIFSEEASRLVGVELIEFLQGKRALYLSDGYVKVKDL